MRPISFAALISSYNYEAYVVDAVESALNQTCPPLQVVVVDDGSTDNSVAVLKARFGQDPRVVIVSTANRGQLAAWIEGCGHCDADVVALLDSDDLWQPGYLEAIAAIYERHPDVDYVYSNMELFGARTGPMLRRNRHRRSRDLGLSLLLGSCVQRWQGVATSGNTLRKGLLARVLDLPAAMVDEWRSRPDDCLFYGADILGAHKYYLARTLVRHREHDRNALLLDQHDALRSARYALRFERMCEHYRRAAGYTAHWLKLAKSEFRTKPNPSGSECWLYIGFALRAPMRWSRKLNQSAGILAHWLGSMTRRRT